MSCTPRTGISTSGNSAVAGIGSASDSHQTTIHRVMASIRQASSGIPAGGVSQSNKAAPTGPATSPAIRRAETGWPVSVEGCACLSAGMEPSFFACRDNDEIETF